MDDKTLQKLEAAGVDIEGAIERFLGNMEMYNLFLKKFVTDKNYESLVEAIDADDVQDAFTAAHALKGTCGNLSFTALYDVAYKITEDLREGNLNEARTKMSELEEEYRKIITLIEEL